MALARRFHGKPLHQPGYDFRDVPWCSRDLSSSTLSVVTERQHLVDSIAELTLLCNEATRRSAAKHAAHANAAPSSAKATKPLSIEYIFDRIDTDDPLWGLMVRTDSPVSFKGRPSNAKASPMWRRGMLQGFIAMTTFTNWQSSFRFDSLHEMAFGQDDDEMEDQMKGGMRKYDEDGSLAEELEATVKGGNPHVEGIVYPRIAEVSLLGGLGCGKQLLRLLIEYVECLKASAQSNFNYDYIVLQATGNSIPFYESMGFTRVGCVQGKAPSPNAYHSSLVEEYFTKKNGETPATVAKMFSVDAWDLVFLNQPLWGKDLVQKSWLKMGTKLFVPKSTSKEPKWYAAQNNDTPRGIAKKFGVDFRELLQANKRRYPDLVGNSKLMKGTNIQISRFHIDESDTVAYSHWTFPDAELDDDEVSYMMAMKLNRKKGTEAKVKKVAASLSVPMKPYSPAATGAKKLLVQPEAPPVALAPIFTKEKTPKEPKKPKRPMSSYAHFAAEARTTMAGELKGLSFGETNKLIGEKWKKMGDDEKVPYDKRARESKREYDEAMKKYAADMGCFKRESSQKSKNLAEGAADISLLEKVVKLKTSISGVAKYEYFYVLTFIPDLQWVHLIPMRKAGVFGPEKGHASGRPIWMIVSEEEGKEIDTTAAVCEPVTAFTTKNSPDADDEQWNIYDNGEIPPPPPPAPKVTMKPKKGVPPGAPQKPKRPATSFAFYCSEVSSMMKEELQNKSIAERMTIFAAKWKSMTDEQKQKYKDQQLEAGAKYTAAMKQYKEKLAKYLRENPGVDASSLSASSSKTPKSSKKNKAPAGVKVRDGESGTSSKTSKSSKKNKAPAGVKVGDGESGTSSKTPKSSKKIKTTAGMEVGDGESGTSSKPPKSLEKNKAPAAVKVGDDESHQTSSNAVSSKTPKSTEKAQTPSAVAGDRDSPRTKQGHPRSHSLPTPKSSKKVKTPVKFQPIARPPSVANSSKTPKSGTKDESLAVKVGKVKSQKKKRGRPRINPLPTPEVMDGIPAPEWKRCRMDKHTPEGTLHTVNKNPVELEKLLGKLTGDDLNKHTVNSATSNKLGNDGIVLSLTDDTYKEIMWRHFNILGKSRDSQKEDAACHDVFTLLKQKMGTLGKFLKRLHGKEFEVDDSTAREKIIADIRRRVHTAQTWFNGGENQDSLVITKAPPSAPVADTATTSLKQRNSDVILSLADDTYKDIMHNHFKKLGKRKRGGSVEDEMGKKIFGALKAQLGKGGGFYKKPRYGGDLLEVDDDAALEKIIRDLQGRMNSSHIWLESDENDTTLVERNPLLTPTRTRRGGSQKATSTETQLKPLCSPSHSPAGRRKSISTEDQMKPQRSPYRRKSATSTGAQLKSKSSPKAVDKEQKLEPSKVSPLRRNSGEVDAHIPSQPAEGFPEGWVKRKIPRKKDHTRIDTRWYSPELNIRFRSYQDAKAFADRVEALGKGEVAAMQPMPSPRKDTAKVKPPLAPIFLKSYGKKKKPPAKSKETNAPPRKSSRYLERKTPAKSEEIKVSSRKSRYPERKRKQVNYDDSHFVSDDSEELSDEPKKKRAKTK